MLGSLRSWRRGWSKLPRSYQPQRKLRCYHCTQDIVPSLAGEELLYASHLCWPQMPPAASSSMATENVDVDVDSLLPRLAWRSDFLEGMIPVKEPPSLTPFQRYPTTSSLGPFLDSLPLGIMHEALGILDFLTLSNLSRTCHKAKRLVESLPAYRDVREHAATALAALTKTGTIANHLASDVHAALCSENCIYCLEFGPYLYLPTCERCCLNCLDKHPALRLLSVSMAKLLFGLPSIDLCCFTMSVPGKYDSVGGTHVVRVPMKLVSMADMKIMSLFLYGLAGTTMKLEMAKDTLERRAMAKRNPNPADAGVWLADWLLEFPIDGWAFLSPETLCHATSPADRYNAMGSIPFPFLRQDCTVEKGLWCSGCWVYYMDHSRDASRFESNMLRRAKFRAWTRSACLEHLKSCEHAMYLAESPISIGTGLPQTPAELAQSV